MVGGPAEQDRQAGPQQSGIEHLEQPGIFEREQGRQQSFLGMVDHQPRLKAGEIARCAVKAGGGQAQLLRIGNVLGVEDREERPARFEQGEVERSRLGPGRAGRNDGHGDVGGQGQTGKLGLHAEIVGLDQEPDVELRGWIIQPRQGPEHLPQHRLLPVHRHRDGVDRQPAVIEAPALALPEIGRGAFDRRRQP